VSKMKNIQINEALIKDKARINEFFEIVLMHTFEANGITEIEGLLTEEIEDKRLCLDQCFDSKGLDRYFLIGKVDELIVASVEYGLSNKLLNDCTNGVLKDMLEIGTVFVHPDYQQRGIGHMMLTKIFERLLSQGVKKVCFDSGYKTAQKIWKKKFGQPTYYLKDYWGDDSHHMVWVIDIEVSI